MPEPSSPRGGDRAWADELERDRGLLRAWREGDAASGYELMEHYLPYFRSLCFRAGVHDADAQLDLFQEVTLRLLQVLPRLRLEQSFAGYLRRVFTTARRSATPSRSGQPLPEVVDARPADDPVDTAETWSALAYCLERLAERERDVFDRRVLNEERFSTISRDLGVTLNHLYVLYHRARQKLQECMQRKGFDLGDAGE